MICGDTFGLIPALALWWLFLEFYIWALSRLGLPLACYVEGAGS